MATNVILPALGMAQDTGKIVEWLKAEGQHVTAGEPLVVVETDKAAVDLEAPATGILARVSAKAGDEVPVAQVIAVILAPEEAEAATGAPDHIGVEAETPAPEVVLAPTAAASAHGTQAPAPAPMRSSANGRRLASPKARRMATDRGVDISVLRGSGPGGVVIAADVLAAVSAAAATQPTPALAAVTNGAQAPAQAQAQAPVPEVAELDRTGTGPATSTVWRLMAERTTQSWSSVPHFFLVRDVAAAGLIAWRERAQRQVPENVTVTDLLVRVAAEALRRHRRLNASWREGGIAFNDQINIGLAVAVEDGLVVPVIHRADDLSLTGIARRRAELVERAQAGRLRLTDLQDGTFTISNLGMYGVDAFNAIISAPQAAILAVGRVADRVVPVDGQPAVRPMLTLSLSCDHRVVDGARGAEFLATIAALIENPAEMAG